MFYPFLYLNQFCYTFRILYVIVLFDSLPLLVICIWYLFIYFFYFLVLLRVPWSLVIFVWIVHHLFDVLIMGKSIRLLLFLSSLYFLLILLAWLTFMLIIINLCVVVIVYLLIVLLLFHLRIMCNSSLVWQLVLSLVVISIFLLLLFLIAYLFLR